MTSSSEEYLQQALYFAKSGHKQAARKILSSLVKREPVNERAWYLLSQVAKNEHDATNCLHMVLKINPNNEYATKRLEKHILLKKSRHNSQNIEISIESSSNKLSKKTSIEKSVLIGLDQKKNQENSLTQKCPHCSAIIHSDALYCEFCGVELRKKEAFNKNKDSSSPIIKNKRKNKTFALFLALLIPVICVCGILPFIDQGNKSSNYDVGSSGSRASIICMEYVKNSLKSPSTAKFASSLETRIEKNPNRDYYRVRSYVDAQNSFGAMLRTYYTCDLEYIGGEWTDFQSWELHSLDFDQP